MVQLMNKLIRFFIFLLVSFFFFGCGSSNKNTDYFYEEFPLERNGIALHLDCVTLENLKPKKNILLVHGVTYSSHEFNIDYKDYSLVKKLARAGYAVWRIDIAGFGQSGAVTDGFMPDSLYAADDVNAAIDFIIQKTGQRKIDLLGWSWGTVVSGHVAESNSTKLDKLVLYAPIVSGLGSYEVKEPFHHNTWEHAVDDFQLDESGNFDYTVAEPEVIEQWCSSCWHYDGEFSPNGGRRDILVPSTTRLINLEALSIPTLLIYGDSDPYLNYEMLSEFIDNLPPNFKVEVIKGASHVAMLEKPFYHDFQNRLIKFLFN